MKSDEFIVESQDDEWSLDAAWRTDPTAKPPPADPGFHWVRLKNGGWAQEEDAPELPQGLEILRSNPAYRKAIGLPPLDYFDFDTPQKAKDASVSSEKNIKLPQRPSQSVIKPYKGSAGAQAIQKANPSITDVNKIQVGSTIKIPGKPDYIIQRGDTLDKIAARMIKEESDLHRILKLSGMEIMIEDAAGQQVTGTGTSNNRQHSMDLAMRDVRQKAAQILFGDKAKSDTAYLYRIDLQGGIEDVKAVNGKYVSTYTITLPVTGQTANQPPAVPLAAATTLPSVSNEAAEMVRLSRLITEDSTNSITVKSGDTLSKIAADNHTTVDAIAKLNSIANPNLIYPGDVIKLPSGQSDPSGLAKGQGSQTKSNDTSDPNHISREERALLNMIARRESNGDYNAINYKARDAMKKGTMKVTGDSGHHPFEGQTGTTAAGRYQMLWNTWKTAAKWAGVDPENFSPKNQDRAALALAKWAYKKKYGGDLSKDIKNPNMLAQVIDGLTPWSVKSGGPGFTTQNYASALSDVQAA